MTADTDPTVTGGAPAAASGATRIADGIVAKVAAWAARDVAGVEDLRASSPRRGWARAAERRRGGASVRVEDGRAWLALRLVVRDGVAIPAVVDEVRARVVHQVEFATGLRVESVDVAVVDVVRAPARAAPAASAPEPSGADAEDPASPS